MDKKILVTGATRGIGKKIFEEMLSCGEVYGLARNREKLDELKLLGARDVLKCDLLNDVESAKYFWRKLHKSTKSRYGVESNNKCKIS